MTDLVPITDPATGRVYRVHPRIAERGEWLPMDKAELRTALPGIQAFERDLGRLLAQHQPERNAARVDVTAEHPHPSTVASPALENAVIHAD